MRKEVKFWTNSLDFGLITGVVLVAYSAVLFMTEQNAGALAYISYAFLIGGMVIGTLNLRNKGMGGYISYGRALGSCYVISLIAAVLSIAFFCIYISYIDEGILDKMIMQAEENMRAKNNMSDEQIEIAMGYTKKFMQPAWMAVFGFLAYAFFGIILSLITAAFLFKNNPNPFGDANNTAPIDQEIK